MLEKRDELITRLQRGEITPDEAEAEAENLGLRPLLQNPDPNDFDPMGEARWTLPMAVAWIAYRTPEAVRECWDEYRTKCWDWEFRENWAGPDCIVHSGHFLEPRQRVNLASLKFDEMIGASLPEVSPLIKSVDGAIKALKDALEIPIIPATGIYSSTNRRETIPGDLWQDLEFAVDRGRDIVRSIIEEGRGFVRYDHVTVPRDAMQQLWPPMSQQVRPELLPLTAPEGTGFMPLYCAAQWIATEGGKIDFDPLEIANWKPAFESLLDYIASGEIAITGVGSGLRERIDGAVFAHCRVDYPFQDANFDLIMTEEFYLSSCPFVDEAHWQKGFNDKFRNGRECRWVQLLVHKPDIARIWEFGGQHGPIVNDELLPSGAPGRPSVMHLVVREFERRCAAGELEEGVAEQSRVLAQWLLDAHPNAKRLTPKTIENNIRAGFRRAKDPRN